MSNTQNAVSVFNFENQQFDVLNDEQGNFWFIGKQVCNILSYANAPDALAKHVDEEDKKTLSRAEFLTIANRDSHSGRGGAQFITIINESGFYSLCLKSQLPSAKKFKRWVTSEVLPSIRKTGKYEAPKAKAQPIDEKYRSIKFNIEGISGFFDKSGLAHFLAYDVAYALGIVINHPNFIQANYTKMEYLLGHSLTTAENGDLLVKEPELYTLVTRSRTRATKEFKSVLAFNVIPELKKYTHYKPQVTTTEIARVAPMNTAMRRNANITVTNVVKDVGGAAEEIVRIFGASKFEALDAAISLAEQSSGLNLEPLREVLDSVEATATIEAVDGDDW